MDQNTQSAPLASATLRSECRPARLTKNGPHLSTRCHEVCYVEREARHPLGQSHRSRKSVAGVTAPVQGIRQQASRSRGCTDAFRRARTTRPRDENERSEGQRLRQRRRGKEPAGNVEALADPHCVRRKPQSIGHRFLEAQGVCERMHDELVDVNRGELVAEIGEPVLEQPSGKGGFARPGWGGEHRDSAVPGHGRSMQEVQIGTLPLDGERQELVHMVQEIVRIFAPRDAPSLTTHAVSRLLVSIDVASGVDVASRVSRRDLQSPKCQLKQCGCFEIRADDLEPTIADAECQSTHVASAWAFSALGEPCLSGPRVHQNCRGNHPG
jgi:hypothetical protein